MRSLVEELRKRPVEPSRDDSTRCNPTAWLESFQRLEPGSADRAGEKRYGLSVSLVDYLTAEERTCLHRWQAKVVARFRQRLAVTEAAICRFAVGGATQRHGGRAPGIAEEVMLTIARRNPIYLSGAFGGACGEIGSLLGLAHPRTGEFPASFKALKQDKRQLLRDIQDKFRPAPWTDLPVEPEEIAEFLRSHSYGSRGWPENGLTLQENRKLFESSNQNEVAQLVTRGLLQLFGVQ